MIHSIFLILAAVAAGSSLVYYGICIAGAAVFLRRPKVEGKGLKPAVSILKPLKGTDPEMYASFRSHCVQDYPEYEILFGVSEAEDPARELVAQLQQEFPQRTIRLILCDQNLGPNTKVSNLAQLARVAKHDVFLVNDSDIRVERDYLQRVMVSLDGENVGLVTCLYRGIGGTTVGSRLEALGISTDFIPGVLTARLLERGIHFGLGSTLAFRRECLQQIGGFEAIADYLADDYELGRRIADSGRRVEIAESIVETFLPSYSLREFVEHQLRWARTIRDARPGGYLGLALTFGLPWSVLTLLLAGGAAWAWTLLGLAVLMRFATAWLVANRVLRDEQFGRLWLWIPVRDFLALGVWTGSLMGKTVWWRGNQFELKKGKLVPTVPTD